MKCIAPVRVVFERDRSLHIWPKLSFLHTSGLRQAYFLKSYSKADEVQHHCKDEGRDNEGDADSDRTYQQQRPGEKKGRVGEKVDRDGEK